MDKEIKKEFEKVWKAIDELEKKIKSKTKKKKEGRSPFDMNLPRLPQAF